MSKRKPVRVGRRRNLLRGWIHSARGDILRHVSCDFDEFTNRNDCPEGTVGVTGWEGLV